MAIYFVHMMPSDASMLTQSSFALKIMQCVESSFTQQGLMQLTCGHWQDVVVNERRFKYEGQVKQDPLNYDAWFDYIRLEESAGDPDKIREVRFSIGRSPCPDLCSN